MACVSPVCTTPERAHEKGKESVIEKHAEEAKNKSKAAHSPAMPLRGTW